LCKKRRGGRYGLL
nr:immunoglobulin heavy chain junction region [Mus musculus]